MVPLQVDFKALDFDPSESLLRAFPVGGEFILMCRAQKRFRRARNQVVAALNGRASFPSDEWEKVGLPVMFAEKVCLVIQDWVGWHPNHFFVPCDSFRALLMDWDGWSPLNVMRGLQKDIGIVIDVKELTQFSLLRDFVFEACRLRK